VGWAGDGGFYFGDLVGGEGGGHIECEMLVWL